MLPGGHACFTGLMPLVSFDIYSHISIPVFSVPVSGYTSQTSSAKIVASLGPGIVYTGFRLYRSIYAVSWVTGTEKYDCMCALPTSAASRPPPVLYR